MLSSLTANFDEKLRLLLDPHYQSSGGSQSDSSSVQSTPSKQHKSVHHQQQHPHHMRRVSEQPVGQAPPHPGSKTQRSLSVGQTVPATLESPSDNSASTSGSRVNKKSELKRGRQVDKHKSHLVSSRASSHSRMPTTESPVPSNKSQNRTDENEEPADKENDNGKNNKANKTNHVGNKNNRKRRLQRRHTVGGTKDFADLDFGHGGGEDGDQAPLHDIHNVELISSSAEHTQDDFVPNINVQQYHQAVMMNVDRSLGMWISRRQKMGTSSPDLTLIGRRLSLPDSVLANANSFATFNPGTANTSLLESQV